MNQIGRFLLFFAGTLVLVQAVRVGADDADLLPEGPIRERHELMEGIGSHAKKIGAAVKAGDFAPVPENADVISDAATRIAGLFPKGSTHEKSRAKPEIWEHWSDFEALTRQLEKTSAALASTARSNGDVRAASQKMFGTCKTCHDRFRVPKE